MPRATISAKLKLNWEWEWEWRFLNFLWGRPMSLSVGNAKNFVANFVAVFSLIIFSGAASAQSFGDRSDAEFALLGPRMESGLRWDVERRRDDDICKLSEADVRQKVKKKSAAVQKAAFDVWSEAKIRCGARKFGVEPGLQGFHVSGGIGGQFDLNASTDTNLIGSASVYDPKSGLSKTGLSSSGVIGQIGIGYDWNMKNLLLPTRTPGVSPDGFVGVNLDFYFGSNSATVQGIPGIVPFIPAGVASMDTLRFRNDLTIDFTARVGTYITPSTGIYVLGGLSAALIKFKYDCTDAGFCGGVAPVTPAFSSEQSKWTYGGVFGFGVETKVSGWSPGITQTLDAAAMSIYLEYRAHVLQPVTIDAGTLPTRYTSQEIDFGNQIIMGGARIRF